LIVLIYLTTLSKTKHYLLIDEANKIRWAFTFFRDDEDWFAIRVKNSQGSGKGSLWKKNKKE
jgi:hypothetical protein